MNSVDIPEAKSLEKVRAVVQAIHDEVPDKAAWALAADISRRHLDYHLHAARILSLAETAVGRWQTTQLGVELLGTSPGSVHEADVFERGIRRSAVFGAIPFLFDTPAPNIESVAEALHAQSDLKLSTAKKRASALLHWRDYIMNAPAIQQALDFAVGAIPRAQDEEDDARLDEALATSSVNNEGSGSNGRGDVTALPDNVYAASTSNTDRHSASDEAAPASKILPTSSAEKPFPRSVITRLRLQNFKNFEDVVLSIGGLTTLVGTNASGKSNVRDAFRFLHGIARGYTLAEIIGEKWVEGGVLQWRGIRGGTREATFRKARSFVLEVGFRVPDGGKVRDATYRIEVEVDPGGKPPRVLAERLVITGRGQFVFDSHPDKNLPPQTDPMHLAVRLRKGHQSGFVGPTVQVISNRPALSQLLEHPEVKLRDVREHVKLSLAAFRSMRFLDLSPDAMRTPSLPGQTILGDRGENLSSVLLSICAEPGRRMALAGWVQELTPMDAKSFEFPADPAGRVLLTLVEEDGSKISAYSASDGTLRFLAMIAALIGPEPADLYFFEELENGIHPTRLHLLLQLIEQQTSARACQVIATTHSPQLLTFLGRESLENAALVYRLKEHAEGNIIRILDIPHVARVLEKHDLTRLHASGWLENAVSFAAGEVPCERAHHT